MKTSHKILSIVGVIALTTLTLNAKWFSTWAEEAKGSKPRDQDTYRVVSPNGDIRSVACSADGKTLFVVCANGWVKGPAGKGYGTQFEKRSVQEHGWRRNLVGLEGRLIHSWSLPAVGDNDLKPHVGVCLLALEGCLGPAWLRIVIPQ